MIPHTFHVYPNKETRDLVCFLSEKEFWRLKYNALFSVLGINQLKTFKPLDSNIKLGNVTHETQMLFDKIDERIAKTKCNLKDGICE